MFALLSVIECPDCSQAIPFTAMNFYGDPDLAVVKCSACGLDIQIQHGKNDEFIGEPLKKH